MSEEQLKSFIEKVQSDTELQEKLKAAATSEEAIAIAKEAGFSIVAEDLPSAVDDSELEDAAGGGGGCRGDSAEQVFPRVTACVMFISLTEVIW